MIYLDHAATTPIDADVVSVIEEALRHQYGNPSSLYQKGRDARKLVEDALEALKKAQKDNNLDEMKEKKDALSKAAQDLAVKLYQQNGGAAGQAGTQAGPQCPQGGNSNNGNNGDAQDGEFHKVDPNK